MPGRVCVVVASTVGPERLSVVVCQSVEALRVWSIVDTSVGPSTLVVTVCKIVVELIIG